PDDAALELPFRIERELLDRVQAREIRRRARQGVGLGTETMAAAEAQQKHGHPLVEIAPFADLLALVEDGPRHAILRAFQRRFLDLGIAAVDRRVPRIAEGAALWVAAQLARG